MTEEARRYKAKAMRYKKPICKSLNLEQIRSDLYEMQETCEDVRWFESDEENLVAALDGDEDEAYEFKMAFADLCAELERFQDDLENEWIPECFDDFFPATGIGTYDGLYGYDEFEGDYFGLTPYKYDWAEKESEKRICRMTKKELLEAADDVSGAECFVLLIGKKDALGRVNAIGALEDILAITAKALNEVLREIPSAENEMEARNYIAQKILGGDKHADQ